MDMTYIGSPLVVLGANLPNMIGGPWGEIGGFLLVLTGGILFGWGLKSNAIDVKRRRELEERLSNDNVG